METAPTSAVGCTIDLTKMRLQFFHVCRWLAASFAAFCECYSLCSGACSALKPEPDLQLIFADGGLLIGQLESAKGSSLTFKSDMAGEVTVDWSKVQGARTSRPFAVITKSAKVGTRAGLGSALEGKLSMTDQKNRAGRVWLERHTPYP